MGKSVLFSFLLLSGVAPGYSQLLSFGVKGGIPLTDALHGYTSNGGTVSTSTERWLVGPTAELHLPFRLSIEVDALYRRQSYQSSITFPGAVILAGPSVNQWFTNTSTTATGTVGHSLNNWQFPILAKYDLRGGVIRPFVDAGVSYRHLSGGGPINDANAAGFTVGGGLTLKLLFLRLSPELRYTHWGNNDVYAPFVTASKNQADFLVGFTF